MRDIPYGTVAHKGRQVVWISRRGNHLGQRSCANATKGRTYERKRPDQSTAKNPCEERAVHICTGVSIVTRAKSFVRSAPLAWATRRLSASSSSSLSPSRLRQWLRSERSCGNSCWKNSSPVKYWKYGSCTQRSHTPSSESP